MIFNAFFRLWRIVSTILLTANLLFCYIGMPENIAFVFDDNGKAAAFTDKQSFFYWSAGIIFILNIGTLFLKNNIESIDFKKAYPTSLWANSNENLKLQISGWFNAFLALINSYLIFVILGLNNINAQKVANLDFNYNKLLMGGAVLLLVLLFYLPIKLLFSNPPLEK
jgi:hypothetical protein